MVRSRELLDEIKIGAAALGIAQSTLCQRALRNTRLIKRLEDGQSVTVETVEKLRTYIREHSPAPLSAPEPSKAAASS